MQIRDVMVPDPISVEPGMPALDAASLMMRRNINCVVVGRGDRVEGVATPRDIMLHLLDGGLEGLSVADIMTSPPVVIDAGATFDEASRLMDAGRIRHLPVTEGGRLVGMISVRDLLRHRAEYLEGRVHAATTDLASKNAALEASARTMQYHLDLAGRIQQHMQQYAEPALDPLSVAVRYQALQRVSGDCYDVVTLRDDRIGLLVADASGHGVAAAFVAVMARAVFQAYGRRAGAPAEVLLKMNERLPRLIAQEHFVTMAYAVLDRRTLALTWALAGHPWPLWHRRARGAVEPLECSGDVIGVHEQPEFEQRVVQLEPGDALLFYTDGVIESRSSLREPFGAARLETALRAAVGGADLVLSQVMESLTAFCAPAGFGDDVTCLAVTV